MTLTTVKPTRPALAKSYGISKTAEGLLDWEWVETRLNQANNFWVSTVRPNGKPHSVPVCGLWLDGALYFGSDRLTVRSRNLAANPHISVHLESADDVVIVEGLAKEIGTQEELNRVAHAMGAKFNAEIMITLCLDPGNIVYKVTPQIVLAWIEKDFSNTPTRWVFEE